MGRLAEKMIRKWKENTEGKGETLVREIKEVEVNPMELAAAQNEVRIAKLKEIEKLWPEIMRRIPKELWVKMVEEAGRDNYNVSVRAKAVKQENFARKFEGVLVEAKRRAKAAPGVTLTDRLKRVEIVVKHLIENKGKWRTT